MENLRSWSISTIRSSDRTAIVIVLLVALQCLVSVGGTPQVPAMFVFGDSLVDDGNNNNLNSLAKGNYYPYGIDFPQGPTGRFCNGRTIIDFFCELIGLPYLPPYADTQGNRTSILNGVNYASAAGGILAETGQFLGERYSMRDQVLNFETTLNDIRSMNQGGNLSHYLVRSIAVVVLGSNDYINNYLLPDLYFSSHNYTAPDYANLLMNSYSRQLMALYSLGLRKFLLANIGPLGCIPNQRATGMAPLGRCVDQVNEIVGHFNNGLRALVQQLNTNHPGAIFVYGNSYGVLGDILNNPARYGFTVIDRGCCGVGRNQGEVTCLPMQVPCLNRNQYVFWDAFHPTQAVNAILAQRAFTGPPSDCYPINVQQMAQL
ncbi:GDSL esterase/lipase [Acorus gramineus]|uniref:GDSL esterase/lipase n=1 Tax=Acorus gramineus TaxID=55184 RepID=A0AAV9BIF6_ACOGR|nr:GDSL esterase/lipase [Acorus gramineus]